MKLKNLIVSIIIGLGILGVLLGVAEIPPYGDDGNPAHNEVSERYIERSLEDTGVENMVTSVVLDYRAFDTMFETIVLFTATLAVVITLKEFKKGDEE